jgi:hypothetical protein
LVKFLGYVLEQTGVADKSPKAWRESGKARRLMESKVNKVYQLMERQPAEQAACSNNRQS